MIKANLFWDWFGKNERTLSKIDNLSASEQENLLDTLLVQLQSVNSGFFFELAGSLNGSKNELIITVGGDARLFDEVDKFLSHAPSLNEWKLISLKPPMGINFVTEVDELKLDPETLWFLPLHNPRLPNKIGIKIGIPEFGDFDSKSNLSYMVSTLVETVIGERMFSLDICHLSVGPLPVIPEKEGYIELKDLSDYIIWKRSKIENL